MGILAAETTIVYLEKVKSKFSKYLGSEHAMYYFKATYVILLLGIVLIVPTVYGFSLISSSLASKEKVDEGRNDAPFILDVEPSIAMNDRTKDYPINNDDSMEDSSSDDDDTSEVPSIEDDDTSEVPSIEDDDTSEVPTIEDDDVGKDPSTNDNQPSSNGTDTNSWPVIMIVEDNSGLVKVKSESDSRSVASSNNWFVINKRTSIRKVEEHTKNFGKNRKVLSEDKNEEIRIYRDNFNTVVRNRIDLTNMLRL